MLFDFMLKISLNKKRELLSNLPSDCEAIVA